MVAVVNLLRVLARVSKRRVEVLAFCNRERAHDQLPSVTITVLTFLVKKEYNEEFRFQDEEDYELRFDFKFFRVFSKYRHPGKLHFTILH